MNQKYKRFVIQKHTRGKDIHWDLMLELDDVLQTYRLDKPPNKVLRHTVNATKIFDHPLKFLTYQGPVNKGKGIVRITEAGTYRILHQELNRIELRLNGKILQGKFILTHIEGDKWQFTAQSQSDSAKLFL
ncbi:MAG: DNA polymerase ligase N-terminal domain-containing protein [Phycisphaerae bacterium]